MLGLLDAQHAQFFDDFREERYSAPGLLGLRLLEQQLRWPAFLHAPVQPVGRLHDRRVPSVRLTCFQVNPIASPCAGRAASRRGRTGRRGGSLRFGQEQTAAFLIQRLHLHSRLRGASTRSTGFCDNTPSARRSAGPCAGASRGDAPLSWTALLQFLGEVALNRLRPSRVSGICPAPG